MPTKNIEMFRDLDVRGSKVSMEARTVEFPFSSEFPVDRYFGKEVLSHAAGACDLSRLNGGANALFNHDMDNYCGVLEKAWIAPEDNRGYCSVRFSKSPEADQLLKDIEDGIIRNVSFGYMINELVLSKQGQNGEDSEYTVTRWTPYEVSFVTIPADPTVGVGRSAPKDKVDFLVRSAIESFELKNKAAENQPAKINEEKTMPDVNEAEVRAAAIKEERDRAAVINAMCKKHNLETFARELIDNGMSVADARTAVLEKIGSKQIPVTGNESDIGLTEKEIRQFSFLKVIRALMDPHDRQAQEAAKFEREVSDAAQKSTGKSARGLLVPFEVLRQGLRNPSKRDLSVTTSTAGGDLVATDLLAASYIELLRNKSALFALGAQSLTGLVGNIAIPRATGSATAYWVGEASNVTESDQAFDQVSMSPKSVGAMTQYSRKLVLQSSLDVESLVRNDISEIIALEIDRVGLYGSGSSNQPLGLKNVSGINTTDLAAAAPTWAEIVGMETKINAANSNVGMMKYLMNATGRGALKTTVKVSSYPVFLMGDDGQVNGYDTMMSNQSAAGDFWFGVWNQLIFGFWSGLDIMVDPYTGAASGNVRVVAHQDVDLAVRHPSSFTRANDTL